MSRVATTAVGAALMLAGCAQQATMPFSGSVPPPGPPPVSQPPSLPAARTFIYPARGQSPQQKQFDKVCLNDETHCEWP
jgi:hypothetical protein